MVVLNRPEKAREFLLEVTELDRCQLALFAALRRIVLKQLGHSLLGILWQQATLWFAKTLHALHYNDFFLLGVTPSAWIAG